MRIKEADVFQPTQGGHERLLHFYISGCWNLHPIQSVQTQAHFMLGSLDWLAVNTSARAYKYRNMSRCWHSQFTCCIGHQCLSFDLIWLF